MSLRDVFKNIVPTVMNAFTGIPVSITYHVLGDMDYDGTAGTITEDGGVSYPIRAFIVKDKALEEETTDKWSLVKEGDNLEDHRRRFLIAAKELVNSDGNEITPSPKDYIVDADGQWANIRLETDSAEATWIVTGRFVK